MILSRQNEQWNAKMNEVMRLLTAEDWDLNNSARGVELQDGWLVHPSRTRYQK